MITATDTESPLVDNTWLNQDSAQRLITLEKLELDGPDAAAFLLKVAQDDEHEAVRCYAVSQLVDLDALATIKNAGDRVEDTVQQQVYRIVAGTLESKHSEKELLEKLRSLASNAVKQVALITKSKGIGSLAIDLITQSEDLADLCLYASSVHVRKSAAIKIEDNELLKEILIKVTGKDKTVTKTITSRLELDDKKTDNTEADEQQKSTAQDSTNAKSAAKTEHNESVTPPPPEPSIEFGEVEKEASNLSYKNTSRLFEIRSQLRKLLARLAGGEKELASQIENLQSKVAEKIQKNNEYQERLKTSTDELIKCLADALEAGKSESATQYWDKIQGNISNTANQVRAELLKASNVYKEKITELRDWRIFAATEKKKEIIVQMQHLIDSKMHASDRSKNISNMHKEWKTLGRSSQNEQLWKEFKKLSDLAYEPCKEYFKERKQLMAKNLTKRREICDTLEAEHKALTEADGEPDVVKLNKLLNESEKNWKAFAPIEQSKIKNLQKRFYGTVNQLRKMRKSKATAGAREKQNLVTKAQELAEHEDNKFAMNEAKRLQQEWKKIGPTSYREDQKYWQEFRAACDTVFSKRKTASDTLREDLKKIEARLNDLLSSLDKLAKKEDSEFRESKSEYKDLAQEFSNSLDPRIKSQRKRLLDRFNTVKRQIDSRFRALPDKKQQLLKQSILEKSTMLQDIEAALFLESDPEKFALLQQSFDLNAWESAGITGKDDVDKLLEARKRAVRTSKSSDEFAGHGKKCEDEFRQLCIQAEIRANTESPAQDKALRMKYQLEQLQSGFGQAKPDPKQNLKYAMEVEMRSLALGPLQRTTLESFTTRLSDVLQRLR